MLRWRLILGVVFVALIAGLCWLDANAGRPGIVMWIVALGIAGLAAGEMRRIYRQRGVVLASSSVYMGALLPVIVSGIPIVFPNVNVNPTLGYLGWLAFGLCCGLMATFGGGA